MQLDDAARQLCAPGRIVDRKADGCVHDVARRVRHLFRVHPEPDGVDAGIALPQTQAAVLALRDGVDASTTAISSTKTGLGLSAP